MSRINLIDWLVYRTSQNYKETKITKNEKPLSRVSPVQYSPRRQCGWVLGDYGGKDLWKRWVLSLEWNSERVMEGESGEQVGDELEWHRRQGVLCKADGTRQEVDSRDEVMHSEMSDWWYLEKKMYRCRERMTTDEEQVPRGAEQKIVKLRSVNAMATIQIRLWFDGRSTKVIKVTVT